MERSRLEWPEDVPVPICPQRPTFLNAEPGDMQDTDRVLTTTERTENAGCVLVETWEVCREQLVSDRISMCASCALKTGKYPLATVLYSLARKHLILLEVGLAPPRDYYTERQREAILVVWSEREKVKAERMKVRADGHN